MTGLTVLAVDDERPALEDLAHLLRTAPGVDAVDTASSGQHALQALATGSYDAVFLDVRMPGLSGVELAKVLRRFAHPPPVVFVSAYESAAVQAFELRAVDYVVKPVSARRLEEALDRIRELRGGADPALVPDDGTAATSTTTEATDDGGVVPVDNVRGGGTRLIPRASIYYLQANGDYVRIVAEEGRFLLRGRLSDMERRWEPHGFVRVHRGFLANLPRATEVRPLLNGTAVLVFPDGSRVPIARRQVGDLRRRLRA